MSEEKKHVVQKREETSPAHKRSKKCPYVFKKKDENTEKLLQVAASDLKVTIEQLASDLGLPGNAELLTHILRRSTRSIGGSDSADDELRKMSVMVQAFYEMQPKDAIEAMLIGQLIALNNQGMSFLWRVNDTSNAYHLDLYQKTAIKLLRLSNETIEALTKYRRGGEQRVTVQHVNVNDGGRAIVAGSIEQPEGGVNRKVRNPMFGKHCGAKARNNNGQPCRQPAMTNGRCRLHGGKTPIKHGRYTIHAIKERRLCRQLILESKQVIGDAEGKFLP